MRAETGGSAAHVAQLGRLGLRRRAIERPGGGSRTGRCQHASSGDHRVFLIFLPV
jgi:hypothetical protein